MKARAKLQLLLSGTLCLLGVAAAAQKQHEKGGTPPTRLGYALNPAIYARGVEIEPNQPYVEGGKPTEYSVSPKLPEGLTLSSSTGVLTGTPTTLMPASDYVVTAQNSAGSTQTTLALKVASTSPLVTNGPLRLVRSGNRIYLGGEFTQVGPPTGSGVMFDASTGAKPGVAAWPIVHGTLNAVAPDSANPGGFYIGGDFTRIGNVSVTRIARILPDGRPDPTWNPNANGRVDSIKASDDGRTVYAGGAFTSIGGMPRYHLAALDAVTGLATDWDPHPDFATDIYALAISGNLVYVSGNFLAIGKRPITGLAAVDATTGLATDWNPRPNAAPQSIAVSDDGKIIYVGGTFSRIGGQPRDNIAALDASTGLATDLNPGTFGPVLSIALDGNTLYLGGSLIRVGGQPRNRLAAIDISTGLVTDWNPNADRPIESLAVSGNTVYVGGYFSVVGGQPRNNLAALDASTGLATDWNPNANKFVRAVAVSGDTIYAGGSFSSVGGQPRNHLAAVDASTGRLTDWNPNVSGQGRVTVSSLEVSNDGNTVYAAGNFDFIGDQPRNYLAALDASTGRTTGWNPDPDRVVYLLRLSSDGSTLYAGGAFERIGGQPRHRLAAVDTTTGGATAWNPSPRSADPVGINSLVLRGDTIYVSGQFSSIGGQPRNHLAELDTDTGRATAWNPNPNSYVLSLALSDKGDVVYAGGGFSSIGGRSRSALAALDTSSGAATDWNPNPRGESFQDIFSLGVSDNTVYAAGAFTSIGGQPRNYAAAVDASTGLATDWNPSARIHYTLGCEPGTAAVPFIYLVLSGKTVYAGGLFTSIGGELRTCFAVLPDGSDRAD